jgi:IS5 family transposase
MVRRRHAQLTLSQVVLFGLVVPEPEALMEPWLRAVDEALEDEDMLESVVGVMRRRWSQSARRGRMGTPAEVVLRMLALKHLRDWSYDELEREVAGSLVCRRFCRIDAGKVPDAKTMVRLGQVVDGPVLRQLLHRLVALATAAGVTRGRKMRVDTTVVGAPIHHPTDSGLCEDAIRVLSRTMRRLVDAGVELGFKLRNVRRSVARRMREIAQGLRRRVTEPSVRSSDRTGGCCGPRAASFARPSALLAAPESKHADYAVRAGCESSTSSGRSSWRCRGHGRSFARRGLASFARRPGVRGRS